MIMQKQCPVYSWREISVVDCSRCDHVIEKYTDEEANLIRVSCGATDYINFGDFCRKELGVQCQYGSHMLDGIAGYPELGKGLRIKGRNPGRNYHEYLIHEDDAIIFKNRVNEWRISNGCEPYKE